MVVIILLLLLDEPVLDGGGGLAGLSTLLTLNLNSHALVLFQAGGEVGLLGGLGGLRKGEGGDLTDGVGVLDGGGLVGLELPQVELLDEVGCNTGPQLEDSFSNARGRSVVYDAVCAVAGRMS